MRIPKNRRSTRGFGLASAKEIEGRDRAYSRAVNSDYHVSQIQSIAPLADALGVDPRLVQEIKDRITEGFISFTYIDITDWGIPNPEAPAGVIAHCDPALETFHKSRLSSRDRMWLKSNQPMIAHTFPGRVFTLRATYRYPAIFTIVITGPDDLDRISAWADDLLMQGESWVEFADERLNPPASINTAAREARKAFQEAEERRMEEMIDAYYASPEGQERALMEAQEIREWKIEKIEEGFTDIPENELGEGGIPELLERLKAECEAFRLAHSGVAAVESVKAVEEREPTKVSAKARRQEKKLKNGRWKK